MELAHKAEAAAVRIGVALVGAAQMEVRLGVILVAQAEELAGLDMVDREEVPQEPHQAMAATEAAVEVAEEDTAARDHLQPAE